MNAERTGDECVSLAGDLRDLADLLVAFGVRSSTDENATLTPSTLAVAQSCRVVAEGLHRLGGELRQDTPVQAPDERVLRDSRPNLPPVLVPSSKGVDP